MNFHLSIIKDSLSLPNSQFHCLFVKAYSMQLNSMDLTSLSDHYERRITEVFVRSLIDIELQGKPVATSLSPHDKKPRTSVQVIQDNMNIYYLILYLLLIIFLLCGAYLLSSFLQHTLDLVLAKLYASPIALSRIFYDSPIFSPTIKFLLVLTSCGVLMGILCLTIAGWEIIWGANEALDDACFLFC